MKKLIIGILALVSAACAASGLAACDKSAHYPNYVNPESTIKDDSNSYVIKTVSKGGLSLDGVKVSALKDGVVVRQGYSVDGKVEFALPLDNYTLNFDNLPQGYYESEEEYVTSNESRDYTAVFSSSVIASTAPSSTRYSVGDVMYDFSFTTYKGSGDAAKAYSSTLSSVLQSKRAVILNFWYIGCSWCETEFPLLDTANDTYSSDVEVIALSPSDTVNDILAYKTQDRNTGNLNLPMGRDTAGLTSMFGITGYPTTVVIDRYGVVAHFESGAITSLKQWSNLIEGFIADDYTQTPGSGGSGGGSSENPDAERELPSYSMPTNAEIQAVLNGDGVTASYHAEEDDDYSWPWIIQYDDKLGKDCLVASNTGKNNSYAIIYADVTLKAGDALSFDYYYSSQQSGDYLYVFLNGTLNGEYSGTTSRWLTKNGIYVADAEETVELAFCYLKDSETSSGEDIAKIANISVQNQSNLTSSSDVRRAAAKNLAADGKSYTTYVEVGLNPNDHYYHLLDESGEPNGAILYMDMTGTNTPWVNAHCASDTFFAPEDKGGYEYSVSFYTIAYWEYSATGSESGSFSVVMNGNEHGKTIVDFYYMQMFSDCGYVPVTEALRAAAKDFFAQYSLDFGDVAPYENEWLELCYYYDHYGDEHEECHKTDDPVKGMNIINAYEVFENPEGEYNKIIVDRELQINRGTYYRFTATRSGVYCFTSISQSTVDPYLFVRDADGNMIDWQDDDLSNDIFNNATGNNFKYYRYLEEGEVIYLVCAFQMVGDTGSYELDVKYVGSEVWHFRETTTADGLWVGDSVDAPYGAIPVGFNTATGYYSHSLDNGNFGSDIYVDFINPNYYDANNNSLYDMIEAGIFGAYTSVMYQYYNLAISKDESDITYGAVKADETLVNILNALVNDTQGASSENNGWLQFASYFAYYGPDGEWKEMSDECIKV